MIEVLKVLVNYQDTIIIIFIVEHYIYNIGSNNSNVHIEERGEGITVETLSKGYHLLLSA